MDESLWFVLETTLRSSQEPAKIRLVAASAGWQGEINLLVWQVRGFAHVEGIPGRVDLNIMRPADET